MFVEVQVGKVGSSSASEFVSNCWKPPRCAECVRESGATGWGKSRCLSSAQPGARADQQRRGCSLVFINMGGAVVGRSATTLGFMKSCHFHIEIYAPAGLLGIEEHLSACKFRLRPWTSGFNGQVILRYDGDDDTDFAMDPSTQETMHASGYICKEAHEAWELLESLSLALQRAGFPHQIGMDDPASERTIWVKYKYGSKGA